MLHCQHTVLQGLNFKAVQLWGFCLISAFHLHNRKLCASKYTDYACFSHFLILLLSFLHLALFKSVQNGSQHLRSAILLKEQYAWWLTSKETRCGGKEFAFLIWFFFCRIFKDVSQSAVYALNHELGKERGKKDTQKPLDGRRTINEVMVRSIHARARSWIFWVSFPKRAENSPLKIVGNAPSGILFFVFVVLVVFSLNL